MSNSTNGKNTKSRHPVWVRVVILTVLFSVNLLAGYEVDLKRYVLENQACDAAQTLAADLLRDYPFDNAYNEIITVTFNPISKKPSFNSFELGEISLNSDHKETDGRFACYLRYKGNSEP